MIYVHTYLTYLSERLIARPVHFDRSSGNVCKKDCTGSPHYFKYHSVLTISTFMGMDIAMRNVYEKPVGVKYEGKVKQQYINYRGRCEAWHHEHRAYLDYENS